MLSHGKFLIQDIYEADDEMLFSYPNKRPLYWRLMVKLKKFNPAHSRNRSFTEHNRRKRENELDILVSRLRQRK